MKYKVTLNGKTYEIEVEQGNAIVEAEYDAAAPAAAPVQAPAAAAPAAPAAPASSAVTGAGEVVSSPLPGTVLDIKVAAGSAVSKGQVVAIIEAMKMENEILAPKDGTVTQVVASKGVTVESGAPLVVIS